MGVAISVVTAVTGCSLLPGGNAESGQRVDAKPSVTSVASPTSSSSPAPPAAKATVDIDSFPTVAAPTSRPNDDGLQSRDKTIRGTSASASWEVTIPEFSGSSVATEVNRRVRAAADGLIAQVKREAKGDGGVRRTLTGDGTVVTNDGRTAQVTIIFVDFLAGTAHPANYVTTTVVDVRTARPVLLTQVVQNPPEGLRYLKGQVVKVAKKKGEPVDEAGLAPKVANWANWQSTPDGLTFYFPDYQLGGYGLREYTVPWKAAELVLSDYGRTLLR